MRFKKFYFFIMLLQLLLIYSYYVIKKLSMSKMTLHRFISYENKKVNSFLTFTNITIIITILILLLMIISYFYIIGVKNIFKIIEIIITYGIASVFIFNILSYAIKTDRYLYIRLAIIIILFVSQFTKLICFRKTKSLEE